MPELCGHNGGGNKASCGSELSFWRTPKGQSRKRSCWAIQEERPRQCQARSRQNQSPEGHIASSRRAGMTFPICRTLCRYAQTRDRPFLNALTNVYYAKIAYSGFSPVSRLRESCFNSVSNSRLQDGLRGNHKALKPLIFGALSGARCSMRLATGIGPP